MDSEYIQLEMRKEAVLDLIAQGVLHLEDIHALNAQSHSRLRSELIRLLMQN